MQCGSREEREVQEWAGSGRGRRRGSEARETTGSNSLGREREGGALGGMR